MTTVKFGAGRSARRSVRACGVAALALRAVRGVWLPLARGAAMEPDAEPVSAGPAWSLQLGVAFQALTLALGYGLALVAGDGSREVRTFLGLCAVLCALCAAVFFSIFPQPDDAATRSLFQAGWAALLSAGVAGGVAAAAGQAAAVSVPWVLTITHASALASSLMVLARRNAAWSRQDDNWHLRTSYLSLACYGLCGAGLAASLALGEAGALPLGLALHGLLFYALAVAMLGSGLTALDRWVSLLGAAVAAATLGLAAGVEQGWGDDWLLLCYACQVPVLLVVMAQRQAARAGGSRMLLPGAVLETVSIGLVLTSGAASTSERTLPLCAAAALQLGAFVLCGVNRPASADCRRVTAVAFAGASLAASGRRRECATA